MIYILFSVISERKAVIDFLQLLKSILESIEFDSDNDLIIIASKKSGLEQFSTPYTLVELGYTADDVADTLRSLELDNYSETLIDKDNDDPPLLMVFGKDISGRLIYIKLKVRGERKVICVSFHYAEKDMNFPYRK